MPVKCLSCFIFTGLLPLIGKLDHVMFCTSEQEKCHNSPQRGKCSEETYSGVFVEVIHCLGTSGTDGYKSLALVFVK